MDEFVFKNNETFTQHKDRFHRTIIELWAMAGDFVSKQYAGTTSVLTKVTLQGY